MNSDNIRVDRRNLLDQLIFGETQGQLQFSSNNNNNNNNRMYVESPTFAKDEEDMYRYVQSRLSNDNLARPAKLRDTFDLNNMNNELSLKNISGNTNDYNERQFESNTNAKNENLNTLMSDLAIASLNNNNSFSNVQTNDIRQAFRAKGRKPTIDDIVFEKELIDSLDLHAQYQQQPRSYVSAPIVSLNETAPLDYSHQNTQQDYFLYQPEQRQQSLYKNQQLPLYQLLPLPNPPPPVNPLFQVPPQQQQQQQQQQPQQMFYQQPLLYNSSYPLNLPTYTSSNDYSLNEPNTQPRRQFPQQQQQQQTQYQQQIIQQKANLASQQSNRSFDSSVKQLNSPTSFDGDNEDLGKDESALIKAYENQKKDSSANAQQQKQPQLSNRQEDDSKRQLIWDKLQKANKNLRQKNSSQVNTARKPPTGQNLSPRRKNSKVGGTSNFLPPEQSTLNFIENNVNAIKNKENLLHRYPSKTYEVMHKKMDQLKAGRSQSDTIIKKPPHYVQPITQTDEQANTLVKTKFQSNSAIESSVAKQSQNIMDAVKTISIPLDSSIWKDSERINLDINLRLVDFLNQEQIKSYQSTSNRSLENFNYDSNAYGAIGHDPLDNHIKKFEKISRSLPVSTGSFNNRTHTLPPLNNRYDQQNEVKLQHEIDYENKNNDGYLATMYKNNQKPNIKTYTLKDYRQFKKDSGIPSTTSTGKLGFDFDSTLYREKLEQIQKKLDYAQRVKARNKRVLSDQTQNRREPLIPTYQQQQQNENEKSRFERAREYFEKNIRQKFYVQDANSLAPKQQQQQQQQEQRSLLKRSSSSTTNSKMKIQIDIQTKMSSKLRKIKSDSNFDRQKQQSQPSESNLVRVRDPITAKVKQVSIVNDTKLDELARRHQEEKNRVNALMNQQLIVREDRPASMIIPEEPPLIESTKEIDTLGNLIEQKPRIYRNASSNHDEVDDKFKQLLERHKQERENVNQFKEVVEVPEVEESVEVVKANGLPLSFDPNNDQHGDFYEDIEV